MSRLAENPQEFADDNGPTDGALVPTGFELQGGRAVLVPIASEPEKPAILTLIEELQDAPSLAVKIELLETFADEVADQRAADCLSRIFERLDRGGRRGAELRAALLHASGISEQARKHGVTRQTFWKAVTRLRRRILKNG